jgi:hypothetical protein
METVEDGGEWSPKIGAFGYVQGSQILIGEHFVYLPLPGM